MDSSPFEDEDDDEDEDEDETDRKPTPNGKRQTANSKPPTTVNRER